MTFPPAEESVLARLRRESGGGDVTREGPETDPLPTVQGYEAYMGAIGVLRVDMTTGQAVPAVMPSVFLAMDLMVPPLGDLPPQRYTISVCVPAEIAAEMGKDIIVNAGASEYANKRDGSPFSDDKDGEEAGG